MASADYLAVKRALDVAASGVGLALLAPVLVGVAIAVRLDDPSGQALYRQPRAGRGGVPFDVLKFRTMRAAAPTGQPPADIDTSGWTDGVPDDFVFKTSTSSASRITRLGAWLRRTSVDELPQLVNVLRGDMSLIGPRPEILPITNRYNERQRRRLAVRPGVTGWAQVRGRNSSHGDKIAADLHYVDHASLGLDLSILARTAAVVLSRRDAY